MVQHTGQDKAKNIAWRERWCFDMGSATCRVSREEKSLTVPSQLLVHKQTGEIVFEKGKFDSGKSAKLHGQVKVISPIYKGRFISSETALPWLEQLKLELSIARWQSWMSIWQTALVAIPSQAFPSDRAVLKQIYQRAGWLSVKLVTKPDAYAAYISHQSTAANGLLIDIGADTTEIVLLTQGRMISAMTWYQGGAELTQSILKMVRQKYGLDVRWDSAEQLKYQLVGLWPTPLAGKLQHKQHTIQGIDVQTGQTSTTVVLASQLHETYQAWYQELKEKVKQLFNPESELGLDRVTVPVIWLTGGGSQLPGLSQLLEVEVGVPVQCLSNPQQTVIRGLELL